MDETSSWRSSTSLARVLLRQLEVRTWAPRSHLATLMSKRLIWSVVLSVIPIKRDRIHRPLPRSIFFSDLRRGCHRSWADDPDDLTHDCNLKRSSSSFKAAVHTRQSDGGGVIITIASCAVWQNEAKQCAVDDFCGPWRFRQHRSPVGQAQSPFLRSFAGLAVDDGRCWARFVPSLLACCNVEPVVESLQRAVPVPQHEVMVRCALRRQILRQRLPLAAS
jgi:hypothetical protein